MRRTVHVLVLVGCMLLFAGCTTHGGRGGPGGCGGNVRLLPEGAQELYYCHDGLVVLHHRADQGVLTVAAIEDVYAGTSEAGRTTTWADFTAVADAAVEWWTEGGPRAATRAGTVHEFGRNSREPLEPGRRISYCAERADFRLQVNHHPAAPEGGARGGAGGSPSFEVRGAPTCAPAHFGAPGPDGPIGLSIFHAPPGLRAATGGAVVAALLLLWPRARYVLAGAVAGFSRFDRDEVLNAPRRAAIERYVRLNPGCTPSQAASALEIPTSSVMYHVRRLSRAGYIVKRRRGMRLILLPPQVRPLAEELLDTRERVRMLRRERPQASAEEIARALDCSVRTVRHHLKWMERELRRGTHLSGATRGSAPRRA